MTATEQVLKIVGRSRKGVDVPMLKAKLDLMIKKSEILCSGHPKKEKSKRSVEESTWELSKKGRKKQLKKHLESLLRDAFHLPRKF